MAVVGQIQPRSCLRWSLQHCASAKGLMALHSFSRTTGVSVFSREADSGSLTEPEASDERRCIRLTGAPKVVSRMQPVVLKKPPNDTCDTQMIESSCFGLQEHLLALKRVVHNHAQSMLFGQQLTE